VTILDNLDCSRKPLQATSLSDRKSRLGDFGVEGKTETFIGRMWNTMTEQGDPPPWATLLRDVLQVYPTKTLFFCSTGNMTRLKLSIAELPQAATDLIPYQLDVSGGLKVL
jgi:hypothetical protein